MTVTIEFPQPGPLMSMNDRPHWAAKARATANWRTATKIAALTADITAPSPALIELQLPVPDRRRRDPMNYAPTMKAAIDGLVDADLWPDDTPEYVRTLEPTLYIAKRGEPRTVRIVISERPTW